MMNLPKKPANDLLLEITLDEEQVAQIDALIEKHATSAHRMTREEMLELLVEKGRELVEQGESLLPYLEPPELDKDTKL